MRTLPEHPNLDQLKRQAKELLSAYSQGQPEAVAEVNAHYRDASPSAFALHDAQLVLARSYGFASWPKLKAFVDGTNVKRLMEAVRADDIGLARALLMTRPELARMRADNMQPIHFAVMNRSTEMVRLLMENGANPREGVYPHRDATSALTLAIDRGCEEIVAILNAAPVPADIFGPIFAGKNEQAIARMQADPSLIEASHPVFGWTPLHVAAKAFNIAMAEWLLEHGADPNRRAVHEYTALDVAASWSDDRSPKFADIAASFLKHGATLTPRAAVALGRTDYPYTADCIDDRGGLLRIAVSHSRREVLKLLLDRGFDPDERTRLSDDDGAPPTWGMPLWECASNGKHDLAELLLSRGADANADVYASGTPLYRAYEHGDQRMIDLLMRYGAKPDENVAGLYRQKELAARLLSDGADTRQLLWAAVCGGDPDIVRMTLEHIDWPRDDPRWFSTLEQAIRMKYAEGSYRACFALVLERCDANLRGRPEDRGQFGLTMLHSIAGARSHVTPEDRVAFATMLLDAGARLDLRDNLLKSTALGWACRNGQAELVKLFLQRGADPVEPDAEDWATPRSWARKMGHSGILQLLG